MKKSILMLLVVGLASAEKKEKNYDYLYADSSVNLELHSLIFPIPEKYEFLRQQIISNAKLDSMAKGMGAIEVYALSGKIVKGGSPSVLKETMSIDGTEISFKEIDHISFTDKKTFGGFLEIVGGVALMSGLFFGGMEVYNLIFRDEYDYKNVLVYAGATTGFAAVFYFPFRLTKHIGFKVR